MFTFVRFAGIVISISVINSSSAHTIPIDSSLLIPRADCRTVTVASGDGCASLAKKCGITGDEFTRIQTDPKLCSTLKPDQKVCCTKGTLPGSQSNPGTCKTVTVVSGDGCASLAKKCGITGDEFTKLQTDPKLCSTLKPDQKVCCSKGSLPGSQSKPETCRTVTVASGDGCASLAKKCGITGDEFTKLQTDPKLCSTLKPDQKICCSKGSLPGSTTSQNQATTSPEGSCTTVPIVSGDTCAKLATKCKISGDEFTKFNSDPKFCSTLQPGKTACCSKGSTPGVKPKPKPNANGSCSSYVVAKGDTCSAISDKNSLSVKDLDTFNDKTTWGWSGCDTLQAGVKICLSTGAAPLPAPVEGTVCGPQKPGTKAPAAGQSLASLNPCPINACCNMYGQCGITPDFCTKVPSPRGNPGTAPAGKIACISNCGIEIVNKAKAPATSVNVGYYESWNMDRKCLTQKASEINAKAYTHLHWAFAIVNDDYCVALNDTHKQFDDFTKLQGVKKIISLGGWGYSTDPATYNKLREAISPKYAETFANSIVDFIRAKNLDGVDIDWEYPGASDIPGIPPGKASDAPDYLAFLKLLRKKMPQGKTISFAAPASYFYLKNFFIGQMSKEVDYIVYMTYDLHGQWDYGNKYSQEGCAKGDCLRSHVNSTETNYALAMVTRAGVDTNKISVGVTSYGRSFKMTKAGCTGPTCTYTGPESGAEKGECTDTAGYLANAEIDKIVKDSSKKAKVSYDKASDSSIVVYNDVQCESRHVSLS